MMMATPCSRCMVHLRCDDDDDDNDDDDDYDDDDDGDALYQMHGSSRA